MRRCLQLAKKGLGDTAPNPLVGCVLVLQDKIIGEGWHQKAGKAHAEVNAINSVKHQEQLKKATLYVNLEPCSHHGKTPPCSDLIIQKGIKKVVVGAKDPNPQVSGGGLEKLKQSGAQVEVGLLEKECKSVNKRFFTVQEQHRPYIILKWAQTQDGFIAPKTQKKGQPTWITNSFSKQLVHKWRSEEQGILVGLNTALKDNPKLNTRLWKGNNPTRILIDPNLKSFEERKQLHLYDQTIKTIVCTKQTVKNKHNLIFEQIDFRKEIIPQIMQVLYKHNLQSVIIEGGRETLKSFIKTNSWDEARVFTGQSYFKTGIKAPDFNYKPDQAFYFNKDKLELFYNA